MKYLLFILAIFVSTATFGQKKSNNTGSSKAKKSVKVIQEPQKEPKDLPVKEPRQCFYFQSEEQNENLVYVTKNVLDYDMPALEVSMKVITYEYDPVAKAKSR